MLAPVDVATGIRPRIEVRELDMSYGDRVIQRNLSFTVDPGDIFVIMGPSGSGKSTLLRHMIGLLPPARGDVYYDETSFWTADARSRQRILRRVGVLYQDGALWSSMTLAENIGLVLEELTDLPPATAREVASLKLALVGLAGFEKFYPSEISGGMRKRAGLARAIALDPDILFFDEPSSGLDPISSRRLDDLILELRDGLGATVVLVTHELASIFAIGTNSIFLDDESKTITAAGNPTKLLHECRDPKVRRFLTRGEKSGSWRRGPHGEPGHHRSFRPRRRAARGRQHCRPERRPVVRSRPDGRRLLRRVAQGARHRSA